MDTVAIATRILPADLMANELATIIFCCAVWGPQLSKRHVLLQCNNSSVVQSINKGSAKQNIRSDASLAQLVEFFSPV